MGAAEDRECKGSVHPGVEGENLQFVFCSSHLLMGLEIGTCLDFSGLLQLLAGPLCASPGLSAPPVFPTLVLGCSPAL